MAILTSIAGWDGVPGVVGDSQIAREALPPSVQWAMATIIQGTAYSMLGEHDLAQQRFAEALEFADRSPVVGATARADLALLALYRDDLGEADRQATESEQLTESYRLQRLLIAIPVYPVAALTWARCGDLARARRAANAGIEMVGRLDYFAPRAALQANLLLARTALLLDDRAQARDLAAEAERARLSDPSAVFLNAQLDDLLAELSAPGEASSPEQLTEAEARILAYLPTHYTLEEIASEIMISRNTVKTHCLSIYRKLGVSSRSEAVTEAQRSGIIPSGPPQAKPRSSGPSPT